MEWVIKRAQDSSNWRSKAAAKPFAGKYPTKIAYAVRFNGGAPQLRYVGAPTRDRVRVFDRAIRRADVRSWYGAEFDAKTVIAEGGDLGPWRPPLVELNQRHDTLHYRYIPISQSAYLFQHHLCGQGPEVMAFPCGNRTIRAYIARGLSLALVPNQINEWTAWVQANKL